MNLKPGSNWGKLSWACSPAQSKEARETYKYVSLGSFQQQQNPLI